MSDEILWIREKQSGMKIFFALVLSSILYILVSSSGFYADIVQHINYKLGLTLSFFIYLVPGLMFLLLNKKRWPTISLFIALSILGYALVIIILLGYSCGIHHICL